MRVALDARWLRGGRIDGIGRVVAELTPELVASGEHEFLVLYHEDWTRELLSRKLDGGFRWLRLDYPILSAREVLRLPVDLREARIDLLYTFNYPTSPLHRGYRVVAAVNDVVPFLFRDGGVQTLRWRLFYRSKLPMRLLLTRLTRVHVPSARTADDLVRLFPKANRKIVVVPYGVTRPRPLSERDLVGELGALGLAPGYVLYVGRYEPYKNVASLVEAHRALPADVRERHPLVLVGDARPGVGDLTTGDRHVVFPGPLEDVEAVYGGACLFVYPSLYEGFGLPPLEAMIRGVPVVTTHHGSLPEVVGDAALLTDGSPAALRRAIDELLADDVRRGELVESGRRRADGFRWETAARRILDDLFCATPPPGRAHPRNRR